MENIVHQTTAQRLGHDQRSLAGLIASPYLGDRAIPPEALATLPTPEPLGPRHRPVPFAEYRDLVVDALGTAGLAAHDEAYVVTKDDNRLFGLIDVRPAHVTREDFETNPGVFMLSIGLRGSHDQSLTRGLVAGSHVLVCSNLCFSGEVSIQTKQTTHIATRLPGMVYEAVQRLPGVFEVQEHRYTQWQEKPLTFHQGDALLTELVRRQILPTTLLPKAITLWDEPPFAEYLDPNGTGTETRSAWTLAQAVTQASQPLAHLDPETGEPTKPRTLALPATFSRTQALSALLDEVSGFDAAKASRATIEAVSIN